MTSTQRKIATLKNKIARATQKPDPTGQIISALKAQIAALDGTPQS
jgi:hypothetical protein